MNIIRNIGQSPSTVECVELAISPTIFTGTTISIVLSAYSVLNNADELLEDRECNCEDNQRKNNRPYVLNEVNDAGRSGSGESVSSRG